MFLFFCFFNSSSYVIPPVSPCCHILIFFVTKLVLPQLKPGLRNNFQVTQGWDVRAKHCTRSQSFIKSAYCVTRAKYRAPSYTSRWSWDTVCRILCWSYIQNVRCNDQRTTEPLPDCEASNTDAAAWKRVKNAFLTLGIKSVQRFCHLFERSQ